MLKGKWTLAFSIVACVAASGAPAMAVTANSLAQLRSLGSGILSNTTVTLSPTGGDPHPVTGLITPGHYWINGDRDGKSEHWLETAEKVPGSWWPHWDKWLKTQGGSETKAPNALGNAEYKPKGSAPGCYVMKRSD